MLIKEQPNLFCVDHRRSEPRNLFLGLEEFSSLDFVAPFAFPVDVKLYPSYWSCIAFPTDLETIRTKINKRFYRFVVVCSSKFSLVKFLRFKGPFYLRKPAHFLKSCYISSTIFFQWKTLLILMVTLGSVTEETVERWFSWLTVFFNMRTQFALVLYEGFEPI